MCLTVFSPFLMSCSFVAWTLYSSYLTVRFAQLTVDYELVWWWRILHTWCTRSRHSSIHRTGRSSPTIWIYSPLYTLLIQSLIALTISAVKPSFLDILDSVDCVSASILRTLLFHPTILHYSCYSSPLLRRFIIITLWLAGWGDVLSLRTDKWESPFIFKRLLIMSQCPLFKECHPCGHRGEKKYHKG